MTAPTDHTPSASHWGDAKKPAGRGRLDSRYGDRFLRERNKAVGLAAADTARGLRAIEPDREGAGLGRAIRPAIREERLRTTAGLRGSPAIALSAWRGRSGRRYVVGVHDLTHEALIDAGTAVFLAVLRDASGIASPVHVASGLSPSEAVEWAERAREHGATELHVHRLAETEAERVAVVLDLTETGAAHV